MNKNIEHVRSILHLLDRPQFKNPTPEDSNLGGPWDLIHHPYDKEIDEKHKKERHVIASAILGREATEKEGNLLNINRMLRDMLDLDHDWQIAHMLQRMRSGLK